MVKLYMVISALVLSGGLKSQEIYFGLESGIGSYSMKGLKDFNSIIFKSLPFEARQVSNYPAYFYYQPLVAVHYNWLTLGVKGGYISSGSRISSHDYSGDYLFDTRIQSFVPAVFTDIKLFTILGKISFLADLEGGILYSKLGVSEKFTMNSQLVTDYSNSFSSKNYYLEPDVKISYNLKESLLIQFNAGYAFQFGKKVFVSSGNEILGTYYKTYGPDWTGIRVGISLIYVLHI